MSENSQGKPFKTLKLTSMKAADPTASPAATSATPEPTLPPKIEPVVSPKPDVVTPAASGAASGEKPVEAKSESTPRDPSKPVSFNLVNLKVGGAKKSPSESESPPALPSANTATPMSADASVSTKTPPPVLSPSAAASAPPGLKPFKFLVPTVKPDAPNESGDASAHKPQEIKLTKAGSPDLGSVESIPSPLGADAGETERRSVFALKQSGPPAKEEEVSPDTVKSPGKAPVAKPSAKPMVLILVAVVALIAAGVGALIFFSGQKAATRATGNPPAEKPAQINPVTTVEPAETATTEPTPPAEPEKPNPDATVAVAPRTQKPELVVWLASAKITTIATQRVTLNDHIYTLGSPVNPEKTLRWIGRDSRTKDLLFIDDNGVIYNRPTGGR